MKRGYTRAIAMCVSGAACAWASGAQALTIVPTYEDGGTYTWSDTMKGVISQAISEWSAAITTNETVNVRMTLSTAGSGSYLGVWMPSASYYEGDNLYPWYAGITQRIDFNTSLFTGANYTWWDPTPADKGADQPFAAWDALSVARHEIGHMLGFANGFYVDNAITAQEFDKWGVHITNHVFDPSGLNIQMYTDDSHRDPASGDLMGTSLVNGLRRRISTSDLAQLKLAYNYTLSTNYVWTNVNGTSKWNEDGNWNIPGLPNAANASATLSQTLTANTTITLNQPVTLNSLTLASGGGGYAYTLAPGSGGSLTISGANSTITASGGNNIIQMPVQVEASGAIVNASIRNESAGTTLTITGAIIGGGQRLGIGGPGTVRASMVVGTNTLSVSGTLDLVGNSPTTASPTDPVAGQVAGDLGGTSITGATTVYEGELKASRIRQQSLNLGSANTVQGAKVTIAESSPGLTAGTPSGSDAYVSVVKSLTIYKKAGAYVGTLDLTNNDIIIDYTGSTNPLATIEAMVKSGYNGGNWQGKGITSSIAAADIGAYSLAVLDNAQRPTPFTTFDGWTVPTTVVIVKFSWVADLDLDGVVTSNDAIVFANNYSEGAAATHRVGDLNYNGIFDSNDAILFANAYNETLPHLPEPASLAVMALGALGLIGRGRRT